MSPVVAQAALSPWYSVGPGPPLEGFCSNTHKFNTININSAATINKYFHNMIINIINNDNNKKQLNFKPESYIRQEKRKSESQLL